MGELNRGVLPAAGQIVPPSRYTAAPSKHEGRLGVLIELTPTGWEAVWNWVRARAAQAEAQSEAHWRKHAHRCINLTGPGEDRMVPMRGALSHSGHLEVLRLKPQWYRQAASTSPASSALSFDPFA